jgi:Winged helix DNA-binding domain
MGFAMAQPILRLRLKIVAALNALTAGAGLEFARLKKLTGATDGNLGAHIETLAKAGYVSVESLRWQEAADHGDRHRSGPRPVRAACGDLAGDHCGEAGLIF